jgi:hypothetical protein
MRRGIARSGRSSLLTFGQPIVQADETAYEHHAAEDDVDTGHFALSLARNVLHTSNTIHAPMPEQARLNEKGRSLTNCPKSNPPAATFAACDKVSIHTVRCRSPNTSIVGFVTTVG